MTRLSSAGELELISMKQYLNFVKMYADKVILQVV